jgi:hypothetical protein
MSMRKAQLQGCAAQCSQGKVRAPTRDDYDVDIHPERIEEGRYYAALRILRTTDGKLIYPFDGCARPGPCTSADEVKEAARSMANELIRADVNDPEA